MRKNVLLFTLLFLSFKSFSQIDSASKKFELKYGLFGGVNVSQIYITVPGSGNAYSPTKTGVNFGLMAETPLSRYFAVQAELSFSQLGWKESGTSFVDSLSITNPKYKLNYLCLPVLLKFKVPRTIKNGNGLAIYAGPQLGYLLSADLKANNGVSEGIQGFKSTDVSGIGGIEYFVSKGIGISVRYQLGFTNIFGKEAVDEFYSTYGSSVSVKNDALTITLGYRF